MPDRQTPSGCHAAVAAPDRLDASLPVHVQSKTEVVDMSPRPVHSVMGNNHKGETREQSNEWRFASACHSPWKAGKSSAYHIDVTPVPRMLVILVRLNR